MPIFTKRKQLEQTPTEKFAAAYKENFKLVFNYLYNRVGKKEDTQDLVSTVFLAAWQNWANYKPESSVKSWLMGIAHHKLADYLRLKYKLSSIIIENIAIEDLSETAAVQIRQLEESNPAANTSANKVSKKLEQLTKFLKRDEKEFFRLRFKKNLKIKEIAAQLGQTENNVKVRQNRLVKKLKKLWEANKNN